MIASTPFSGTDRGAVRLRIAAKGAADDFSYATVHANSTMLVADEVDRMLSSKRSNQFTGTIIGVLAERAD